MFNFRRTNRLEESKNIFDTIVNNLVFRGVSIILFLNKTDLLAEKLKSGETNIRWFFPTFSGDERKLEDVQEFLVEFFRCVKRDPRKPLFHHFTTAVDTENIKVVFNAVKDTILHRNLESLMLQWHKFINSKRASTVSIRYIYLLKWIYKTVVFYTYVASICYS